MVRRQQKPEAGGDEKLIISFIRPKLLINHPSYYIKYIMATVMLHVDNKIANNDIHGHKFPTKKQHSLSVRL